MYGKNYNSKMIIFPRYSTVHNCTKQVQKALKHRFSLEKHLGSKVVQHMKILDRRECESSCVGCAMRILGVTCVLG